MCLLISQIMSENASMVGGGVMPTMPGLRTMLRPIGASHFSGMPSGFMMPRIEPTVAPVQSVSSPKLTASQIDLLKSPLPSSRPATMIGKLTSTSVKLSLLYFFMILSKR